MRHGMQDTAALRRLQGDAQGRAVLLADDRLRPVAANRATKMYDDTVYQMAKIIANGVRSDQRAAYLSCTNRYATARMQMVGAAADMDSCRFARTKQEYTKAADIACKFAKMVSLSYL
jgi:hypothetical protein